MRGARTRRSIRRVLAVWMTAVAVLCVVTACAPGGDTEEPAATGVEIPDTPVGEKSRWVLGVLDAEADTTAAEWEAELDRSFLDRVSAEEVAQLLNVQVRPARPFTVLAYEGTDREAVVTVQGAIADPFDISLALDADGAIVGLVLTPAQRP